MISVTTQAAEELKSLMDKARQADTEKLIGDDVVLRLTPTDSGQLSLAPDKAMEDDQKVEHDGSTVLVIGLELAEAVNGLVLDCEDTPQGRRLTVYEQPE